MQSNFKTRIRKRFRECKDALYYVKKYIENLLLQVRARPPNSAKGRLQCAYGRSSIKPRTRIAYREIASFIMALIIIFQPVGVVLAEAIPTRITKIVQDIRIDGESLEAYTPDIYEYELELDQGIHQIPEVEFIYNEDTDYEIKTISKENTLPYTENLIISKNGVTQLAYTVKFTVKDIENDRIRITEINAQDHVYMQKGESTKIDFTTNQDASIQVLGYEAPLWEDPDRPIFSVDSKGNIEALNEGEAILVLTPKDNLAGESYEASISKNIVIHVTTAKLAQSIEVKEPRKTLRIGEEYQVGYEVGRYVEMEWVSDNSEICSVDETGIVVATGSGSATIIGTDKLTNESIEISIEVQEANMDSLEIINTPDKLSEGSISKLQYKVYPEDISPGEILWVSDNTDVISVTSTGLIRAHSEGKATIVLLSSKGLRDEVQLEVLTGSGEDIEIPHQNNQTKQIELQVPITEPDTKSDQEPDKVSQEENKPSLGYTGGDIERILVTLDREKVTKDIEQPVTHSPSNSDEGNFVKKELYASDVGDGTENRYLVYNNGEQKP